MKRRARFSLIGAGPGLAALAPLGALALAAIAAAALVPAPRPSGGALQAGERLMAAGDYARAVSAMRAAYRDAPTPERRLALARALLGAGDYGGALDLLTKTEAGQGAPPAAFARVSRHLEAEALMRAQRFEEAAALAETLSATQPGDGRARLVLARASYGVGARADAEAHLRAALRAGGETLADAWLLRARLALDADDSRLARSAIARAREAGAQESLAGALAVEAEIRDGALERAEQLIRARMTSPSPMRASDAYAEKLRAHLDMARGDYRAAARRVRGVTPWLAAQPQGRLFAALVHAHDGDDAQADAFFRAALRAAPADALTLDAYAAFLIGRGRAEKAPPILDRLSGADPGAARFRRAALARREGDTDALIALLKAGGASARPLSPLRHVFGARAAPAAIEAGAEGSLALLFEAASALRDGARAGDLAALARTLLRTGEDAAAAALAGDLLLGADEDGQALLAYERALTVEPALESGLMGLLRVRLRAGSPQTALAPLEAAAPQSFAARMLLARLHHRLKRGDVAAALLLPDVKLLLQHPENALFFASLLHEQGAGRQLARFAVEMRRAQPAAPETATILTLAGLKREAAATARAALLAAPSEPARAALYEKTMAALGREAESAALLAELSFRPSRRAAEGAPRAMEALRRRYLTAPEDAEAARRYAKALQEAGERAAARRVRREALFWAEPAGPWLQGQRDS